MSRQQSSPPPSPVNKLQQMAHVLFKQILNQEKIQGYVNLQPNHLKLICKQAGTLFHRKLNRKPKQILAFLSSYHQIITGYTNKVVNKIINDISLHFLLLSSYAMIQSGNKHSAKQFLKKALNYVQSTDPDPILLTTALNNLCVLRMQEGKYYKSVNVLLQMIQIMELHMRNLKQSRNKSQLMQDSVFLINSYYLLCKCLIQIKIKNSQPFYKNLLHQCLETGVKKALKYLGKQSFLTRRLIQIKQGEQSFDLPMFKKQQLVQTSTYEQKLMKRLDKIEQLLNSPRDYIIKQIKKEQEPKAAPKQQKDLVCQCTRMINNWNVQIQILKEKGQKLGSVVFNCKKGNDYLNLIIGQERMFRLLSQMNIADILPEQCNLSNLAPHQFIEYCIFNFLHINENKNIEIFPRANSFITTFLINIFKKQYIIFLYHIRQNNFRVALGAKNQSQTFNIQMELQPKFISKVLQIEQQTQKRVFKIYQQLMQATKRQNNMKLVQVKTLKVRDENKIIKTIEGILKRFQIFIKGFKSEAQLDDLCKQQLDFYKFVQFKQTKEIQKDKQKQAQKNKQNGGKQKYTEAQMQEEGKFYYIRYLINIRGFQVNVQNTYETHNPSGKSKAKGQLLYNSYQFFRDFGTTSQTNIIKFRSFCQTLSYKYELKSYQSPLTTNDKQIYQQNSINEVKITSKTFLRKMRPHSTRNSVIPITACLITVNNQIPVGIKILAFDPITCFQVGYFIHVAHHLWRWPQKIQQLPQDIISNVVEQYGYKRQYFLVDWLERFGYRKIIDLLHLDQNDNFYIKGINCTFIRLANLIDLMP